MRRGRVQGPLGNQPAGVPVAACPAGHHPGGLAGTDPAGTQTARAVARCQSRSAPQVPGQPSRFCTCWCAESAMAVMKAAMTWRSWSLNWFMMAHRRTYQSEPPVGTTGISHHPWKRAAGSDGRAVLPVPGSACRLPGLAEAFLVGGVKGSAGAVQGGGNEVAVDLVGDLDAGMAEPAGDLGDRDALGQRDRGVQVAQGVRDELRREPGPGSGPLE